MLCPLVVEHNMKPKNHSDSLGVLLNQWSKIQDDGTQSILKEGIPLLKQAAGKGTRMWQSHELIAICIQLSSSYMMVKDYHAAQKVARKILKLSGGNLFDYGYLCTIAKKAKKVRAARYWLNKALRYRDEDPEFAATLQEGVEKLEKEKRKKY